MYKTRLNFFVNKVFYWKFLSLINSKNVSNIDKILISINIRDLKDVEDGRISKFFYFLESVVGQRGNISNYRKSSLQKKNMNITQQVCLRGFRVFNFVDFFFFFLVPELKRDFIKISTFLDNSGNFSILIKSDPNIFSSFLEDIYMSYPIKIDFVFKHTSKEKTDIFLRELGINNQMLI